MAEKILKSAAQRALVDPERAAKYAKYREQAATARANQTPEQKIAEQKSKDSARASDLSKKSAVAQKNQLNQSNQTAQNEQAARTAAASTNTITGLSVGSTRRKMRRPKGLKGKKT